MEYGRLTTYPTEDIIQWALSLGIEEKYIANPSSYFVDFVDIKETSKLNFLLTNELERRKELREAWLDFCNHVAGEIIC